MEYMSLINIVMDKYNEKTKVIDNILDKVYNYFTLNKVSKLHNLIRDYQVLNDHQEEKIKILEKQLQIKNNSSMEVLNETCNNLLFLKDAILIPILFATTMSLLYLVLRLTHAKYQNFFKNFFVFKFLYKYMFKDIDVVKIENLNKLLKQKLKSTEGVIKKINNSLSLINTKELIENSTKIVRILEDSQNELKKKDLEFKELVAYYRDRFITGNHLKLLIQYTTTQSNKYKDFIVRLHFTDKISNHLLNMYLNLQVQVTDLENYFYNNPIMCFYRANTYKLKSSELFTKSLLDLINEKTVMNTLGVWLNTFNYTYGLDKDRNVIIKDLLSPYHSSAKEILKLDLSSKYNSLIFYKDLLKKLNFPESITGTYVSHLKLKAEILTDLRKILNYKSTITSELYNYTIKSPDNCNNLDNEEFLQKKIREFDNFILICTENYKEWLNTSKIEYFNNQYRNIQISDDCKVEDFFKYKEKEMMSYSLYSVDDRIDNLLGVFDKEFLGQPISIN